MARGALITLLAFGAFAGTAQAATVEVTVGNNAFSPADVTITQGDSVTWTFTGPDTNHSITSHETGHQGSFDSDRGNPNPNHAVGDKFSQDFSFVHDFPYSCKVHPEMGGRIIVKPKPNDPNASLVDTSAPKFATPKVSVAKRRARFTLDEPARVTAKLRGPTRRTLKLDGKAGRNVLKLPKRMRSGRYALVMWATDAARNRSRAKTVKFRVR